MHDKVSTVQSAQYSQPSQHSTVSTVQSAQYSQHSAVSTVQSAHKVLMLLNIEPVVKQTCILGFGLECREW